MPKLKRSTQAGSGIQAAEMEWNPGKTGYEEKEPNTTVRAHL